MRWLARIGALVAGAVLLTLGRGLRQAAAAGEMSPDSGQLGLVLTVLSYAAIFVVWFILPQTKIQRKAKP
jgi:hypothetical protein